jgi:hypothetical protein
MSEIVSYLLYISSKCESVGDYVYLQKLIKMTREFYSSDAKQLCIGVQILRDFREVVSGLHLQCKIGFCHTMGIQHYTDEKENLQ